MIDTYVFILYSIVLVIFLTMYFLIRKRYRNAIISMAQLIIDKDILMGRLEKAELAVSKEVNDGFIKFLSQSRDAAFKYIEDVQVAIKNYLSAIESGDEDRVQVARMELFSHLPESTEAEDKK